MLASGLLLLAQLECSVTATIEKRYNNYAAASGRERLSLNTGWRFSRFTANPDSLSYNTLKPYMLPAANDFIAGTKYTRPGGTQPGSNVGYVKDSFDDNSWEAVSLPHDWAIKGPFNAPGISGGMGRLPSNGVGWYRRKISISVDDINSGRSLFLDVEGAMSYAAVWLNGNLVGGWPYGYASWRVDLTPYAKSGDNLLAIRLENALDNSRWYPGAGIYRDIWLVKTNSVHVGQFGTYVTTPSVSSSSATINIVVDAENKGNSSQQVQIDTKIYAYDAGSKKATGDAVATITSAKVTVAGKAKQSVNGSTTISNPKLWGPPPSQKPNQYVAVTTISVGGSIVDSYETPFGIRSIKYDPTKGLIVNGESIPVRGVCNHHDLGSIGTAFNARAAERQQLMLQELGSNALRTSHNPPAPGWLDIADRLGMMVMDEVFDAWAEAKRTDDYHVTFVDWHEADLRAFIRRDRNHPSIISWSIGNEVTEQESSKAGQIGRELVSIAHQEDSTRQTTTAMNYAKANSELAAAIDIPGLNYQGEGWGTSWSSEYPSFQSKFPNRMLWSSESASTVSTRGTYFFPVTKEKFASVYDSGGGNSSRRTVSAYELYGPVWSSSPDKVFEQLDRHPYSAGEFVWTGWDYIGEPTPYDSSRSSYFGIIDLAGFKKSRFYLYQSRWRPDFPMAHVLPHWTWPNRVGQVTPVHVFTSGDEAELFVNGKSAGRKKKGQYVYRLRWDDVTYAPGNISVVAYKNGKEWARDSQLTAGTAAKLNLTADRTTISSDGQDLSFITAAVTDANGIVIPEAANSISFKISGPGRIVSTDNGDPTDLTAFPSTERKAFSGLALAIVKAEAGPSGTITVSATAAGLTMGSVTIQTL